MVGRQVRRGSWWPRCNGRARVASHRGRWSALDAARHEKYNRAGIFCLCAVRQHTSEDPADDQRHPQEFLPLLPCLLPDGCGAGRRPRRGGASRSRQRALWRLHLHQGPAVGRADVPARAAARAAETRCGGLCADQQRAGIGRDRRAVARHRCCTRAARGGHLQRHLRLPEFRASCRQPRFPRCAGLAVLLHQRHHRPAGQGFRRHAARLLGRGRTLLQRRRRGAGVRQ